jgi:hypothetical protein
MTVKLLATGVAAAAAIGAATAGMTSVIAGTTSADPAVLQVQHVVFGTPLPLEPVPAPPAPPEPAHPATPGAALPTTDEVAGMLTRLTNAGISYKEKGNLVENGITQSEGHGLDSDLRKAYRDGELPYTFDVSNVTPAGPNQAAATVTISGPKMPAPQTIPITLVDQGSWVLSHDSATQLFQMLAQH